MAKPIATAIIDGSTFGHGGPERVAVPFLRSRRFGGLPRSRPASDGLHDRGGH